MTFRASCIGVGLAAIVVAASCSSDATGPLSASTVRLISGDGTTDSIDARPSSALVVEVVDRNGSPRAGVEVVFAVVSRGDPVMPLGLSRIADSFFADEIRDTTDEMGRAAAIVRLGGIPGPAEVDVTVSGTTRRATAHFIILPGAAADIVLAPRDTAMYIGGSYSFDAAVIDRRGNARSDIVTLVPAAPNVTVAGREIGATAFGRAHVVAHAGTLRDTGWVSVVPRGTVAVYKSERVLVVNLDGSMAREVVEQPVDYGDVGGPAWTHRGDTLLFVAGSNFGWPASTRFMLRSLGGGTRAFLPAWQAVGPGDFSADGAWMYFSRNECNLDHTLYRARGDGSAPEHIGPPSTCSGGSAEYPSPSPDGGRLVYQLRGTQLARLDVGSGVVTPFGLSGRRPRWSPVSDDIAYVVGDEVRLVRADGTGTRTLSARGRAYAPGLDWSPDGAWIIGHATDVGRLELIEVASGLVLRLPYSAGMMRPAWRP